MRLGRLRFGRRSGADVPLAADTGARANRAWSMGGVIVVCSAALLGTSETGPSTTGGELPPPSSVATYLFERRGIDGGFAELTADAPRATFVVTITADALGPDNVVTTPAARADIEAIISATGLAPGSPAPNVSYEVRTEGQSMALVKQARERLTDTRELTFHGDCSTPTMGSRCVAHYSFEVWRADDGAAGGSLRIDWTTDLFSTGKLSSRTAEQFGPLDPPWTVVVTAQ